MKKKVVLFDIDYTLFDVSKYRDRLYRDLARVLKREKKELEIIGQRIYDETRERRGYFDPALFTKELLSKIGQPQAAHTVSKVIWNKEHFKESVYQETKKVLEDLSEIASIGIFSKGVNIFQKAKLTTIQYMLKKEHIHIIIDKHSKVAQIMKKYEAMRLYLVDDALSVLHTAKKVNRHIFTIWIKRGRFAEVQEPIAGFLPDATVKDLRPIPNIVSVH